MELEYVLPKESRSTQPHLHIFFFFADLIFLCSFILFLLVDPLGLSSSAMSSLSTSATTTSWVRREVPKDHACLFASLVMLVDGVETYRSSTDRFSAVLELRKHCADTVVGDAETWPEWKLGRAPAEYAAWITKPDTWGGEIELLILSAKLGVEVSVVDMATQNIITYN